MTAYRPVDILAIALIAAATVAAFAGAVWAAGEAGWLL